VRTKYGILQENQRDIYLRENKTEKKREEKKREETRKKGKRLNYKEIKGNEKLFALDKLYFTKN